MISMPSDSAAAGLIALGILRRFLEDPNANDLNQHFEKLKRIAQLHKGVDFDVRSIKLPGVFKYDSFDKDKDAIWVYNGSGMRCNIIKTTACDWNLKNESPVIVKKDSVPLNGLIIQEIVNGSGRIIHENLSASHSGVCLAGRVLGETATRNCYENIRFKTNEDNEFNLSQLLTINQWSPDIISRMTFYNTRTGELDRQGINPKIVIADGDASFIKAFDADCFGESDIIGVFDRTFDRNRLEDLVNKMNDKQQWFQKDDYIHNCLPARPCGIGVYKMKRRN